MQHFVFNLVDGDRERAAAFLDAETWPVGRDERHRDALAQGDLVLIHVAQPPGGFIGRAELATAVHETHPGGGSGEVTLTDVQAWDRAVPLATVVEELDPNGSNPYVQANAAGFRAGVVQITADEYATVLALNREASEPR